MDREIQEAYEKGFKKGFQAGVQSLEEKDDPSYDKKIKTAYGYVTMTDKFMSGWGMAEGMDAKFVIACDNSEQINIIKKAAKNRSEMIYVSVSYSYPRYRGKQVTYRHFDQLGGVWKQYT